MLTRRDERIWGTVDGDLWDSGKKGGESEQAVKGSRIGLHLKSLARRPCLVSVISFQQRKPLNRFVLSPSFPLRGCPTIPPLSSSPLHNCLIHRPMIHSLRIATFFHRALKFYNLHRNSLMLHISFSIEHPIISCTIYLYYIHSSHPSIRSSIKYISINCILLILNYRSIDLPPHSFFSKIQKNRIETNR